jgi:hypothetical protein
VRRAATPAGEDVYGVNCAAKRAPLRSVAAPGGGQACPENGPGVLPGHRTVVLFRPAKRSIGAGVYLPAPHHGPAQPAPQLAADAGGGRDQRHRFGPPPRGVRRCALALSGGDAAVDFHLHAVHELVVLAGDPGRHGVRHRHLCLVQRDGGGDAVVLCRILAQLSDRRFFSGRGPHPALAVEHPPGLFAAAGRGLRPSGSALPTVGFVPASRPRRKSLPRSGPRSGRCASSWRPSYGAPATRPIRSPG